jgi:hypothetical protein
MAGETQLGKRGDHKPGPPVSGVRIPQLRRGPAESLFEEPERVFKVEPAQESLPEPVHM